MPRPAGAERGYSVGHSAGAVLCELTAVVGEAREAERILSHVLGTPMSSLRLRLDSEVGPEALCSARAMAGRRAAGEPLQHVLGSWGFRSLDVLVDRRALVPRPETEQLVDLALAELGVGATASAPVTANDAAQVAVDLGTGSGVIALSLAAEGPSSLEVWATERSAQALELAHRNLELLAERDREAAGRVHLCPGSWFDPLPAALRGRLQLVVSNPPYVAAAEWDELDAVVRHHDPYEALVPGPSGLEALAAIMGLAPGWLTPGGVLVMELAPWQGEEVRVRAMSRGFADVEVRDDLSGRPRFVLARWPGR